MSANAAFTFDVYACCRLGPQVNIKTYEGAEHTEILSNDAAVADLLQILHEEYTPTLLQRLSDTVSNFRTRGQFR